MRLEKRIVNVIKGAIFDSFGVVDIYLFGSRVDDNKKGGDIDLAVNSDVSREKFRKNKVKFISTLIRLGYDFKIDLVPYNTTDTLLKEQIQNNNILLT